MTAALTTALAAGLLGSAHCVGMCGGFLALVGTGDGGRRRSLAYVLGKTGTYAAFGLVAGLVGGGLAASLGGLAGVVAVALGVAMVVVGLGLCGVAWRTPVVGGRWAQRLGPMIGRLVGSGSLGSMAGLGALNGLLPCGLVYGVLAVAAATGSAVGGAATMAVFGLATAPALVLTGALSHRLRPSSRVWMQRAAGALVVVMGVITVARGAEALGLADAMAHGAPGHGVHMTR